MRTVIQVFMSVAMASAVVGCVEPVHSPAQDEQTVREYWTLDRMTAAERSTGGQSYPVEEVISEGGDSYGFVKVDAPQDGLLSRRAGVLFFLSGDGVDQHCSATVLESPGGNLILTTAHCVVEADGKWMRMMMFVPAYDGNATAQSRTPYGRWPVQRAYLPQAEAQVNEDTDIAIASTFKSAGKTLQETVGGASSACISEGGSTLLVSQLWGYPGVKYSGGEMYSCLTRVEPLAGSSGMVLPNCSTVSGSRGSGLRFDRDGKDWVVGVASGTRFAARLRSATFTGMYRMASETESSVSIPHCAR